MTNTKPQSIIQIWCKAIKLYPKILINALPFVFLMGALSFIFSYVLAFSSGFVHVALDFVYVALLFWPLGVVILLTNGILHERKEKYWQVAIVVSRKYWKLFLAYLVAVTLLFLVYLIQAGFYPVSLLSIGINYVGATGGLLLFVLITMLLLFKYCILIGNDGPLKSIGNSVDLISGHWWRTVCAMVPGLVYALILLIPMYIGLMHVESVTFLALLHKLVVVFMTMMVAPLAVVLLVLQYNDLVARRFSENHSRAIFARLWGFVWRVVFFELWIVLIAPLCFGILYDVFVKTGLFPNVPVRHIVELLACLTFICIFVGVFFAIKKMPSALMKFDKPKVILRLLIIIIFLLLFVNAFIYAFNPHLGLPEKAVRYMSWVSHQHDSRLVQICSMLLDGFSFIYMLLMVGLFFFKRWARYSYLIVFVIVIFAGEISTPFVEANFSRILGIIMCYAEGMVVACLIFVPSIKVLFNKTKVFKNKEEQSSRGC